MTELSRYFTGKKAISQDALDFLVRHDYDLGDRIGGGAVTENFHKPGDRYVARVIKRRCEGSERNTRERANALVYSGELGIIPPAFMEDEVEDGSVLYNEKMDTGRKLKDISDDGDELGAYRVIKSLKKIHDGGHYLQDPADCNLFDPEITGGYLTVDTERFGTIPSGQYRECVIGDLIKTYRDAGDIVLDPIRRHYGDSIADELVDIRQWETETGQRHPKLPITPTAAVPANDLTLKEAA